MFFPKTIDEVLAMAGKFEERSLVLNFSTAIAAGSNSGAQQVNNWTDGWLIVTQQFADVWTSAGTAGAPPQFSAGQSVARWSDASPPATVGNSFPGRNQFRFQGTTNSQPWSLLPVNLGLYFGTADAPFVLSVPRFFPPQANIQGTLYNDVTSPATFPVVGQVVFNGYFIPGRGGR